MSVTVYAVYAKKYENIIFLRQRLFYFHVYFFSINFPLHDKNVLYLNNVDSVNELLIFVRHMEKIFLF